MVNIYEMVQSESDGTQVTLYKAGFTFSPAPFSWYPLLELYDCHPSIDL